MSNQPLKANTTICTNYEKNQSTCHMPKRKKWQKPIAWLVVVSSIILLIAIIVSARTV
ncbi:hypothetical protein GCM10007425_19140 [Lysinibacillus alkalisoli]|uniref:Uncharacterized protein n=1 Tax=Lysinibacillus alkalisoli TaxID=1911548 RepID=A0A917LHT5_9BACI|nr:hypothetical protein [Lysinibacillus alkalisoli]GGG24740.1 hypothetical protein GCM10007425_19140 [Lysinibacillus alkalisoli]